MGLSLCDCNKCTLYVLLINTKTWYIIIDTFSLNSAKLISSLIIMNVLHRSFMKNVSNVFILYQIFNTLFDFSCVMLRNQIFRRLKHGKEHSLSHDETKNINNIPNKLKNPSYTLVNLGLFAIVL